MHCNGFHLEQKMAYQPSHAAASCPDGFGVMIDFEVAIRAVWTEQVVQEVVEQHPISGSALFGGQLCLFICHPSRGLETPTNFFISCYLPEGWK